MQATAEYHHGPAGRSCWQAHFERLLPPIGRQLAFAFARLDHQARDEAIQEALVNCCVSYARLHRQGRAHRASATSLARYAIRQVRCGRTIATPLNARDPLSAYAQRRHALCVVPLEDPHSPGGGWLNGLVSNRRTDVAVQAALRIDFAAWLNTLAHRLRQIARDLALGFTTSEVARRYGLSPGRISQIRRELYDSWCAFQTPAGGAQPA